MDKAMNESFKSYIQDQLSGMRGVMFRPMFGGYGLYAGTRFFGIVFKGRLYFKTDAESASAYREQGMAAFRPSATQTLRNYYEVPPDVLEDGETLVQWAEEAIRKASDQSLVKKARRASHERRATRDERRSQ